MSDQKLHTPNENYLTHEEFDALCASDNIARRHRFGKFTLSEPDAKPLDPYDKWWLRGTVIALVAFWVGIIVLVRGCA